jgi:transcriptional regulator with XRE-family HTH domain
LARGLSQQELAEKCHVSPNAIGLLERRELFTRPETLDALAKALGVDVADLFADHDADQVRAELVTFARSAPQPLVAAISAAARVLLDHLGNQKPAASRKK